MSQDLLVFCGCAALLVGYLIFSAKTEMGTKLFSVEKDAGKDAGKDNDGA